MQQKKIPMRKCVGCNEMKPKKELVRIVKTPEGDIRMDLNGKMNGRGAYICHDNACLTKARKAGKLERTFECRIPDEIYELLSEEITHE